MEHHLWHTGIASGSSFLFLHRLLLLHRLLTSLLLLRRLLLLRLAAARLRFVRVPRRAEVAAAEARDGERGDALIDRALRVGAANHLQDLGVLHSQPQQRENELAALAGHLLSHDSLRVVVRREVAHENAAVRTFLHHDTARALHLHALPAANRAVEHLLVDAVVRFGRARDRRLVQALVEEPLLEVLLAFEGQTPEEVVLGRHVHFEVPGVMEDGPAARARPLPVVLRGSLGAPFHDDAAARLGVHLEAFAAELRAAHAARDRVPARISLEGGV